MTAWLLRLLAPHLRTLLVALLLALVVGGTWLRLRHQDQTIDGLRTSNALLSAQLQQMGAAMAAYQSQTQAEVRRLQAAKAANVRSRQATESKVSETLGAKLPDNARDQFDWAVRAGKGLDWDQGGAP
jgi:Tfp pilus assembly protein PilN